MERVYIEATRSTPLIDFNPFENILVINGQSYPEDSYKFYEPLIEWIEEYFDNLASDVQVHIKFKLTYINTSSSKCIMMILDILESVYNRNKKFILSWYYDEDNEAELECAEEFKEDYSFPFDIIPIEE